MNRFVAAALLRWSVTFFVLGGISTASAASATPAFKFDFGSRKPPRGHTSILADSVYTERGGYGFDLASSVECFNRGGKKALGSGYCSSDHVFFFSVAVPEGNYNVTVTLGNATSESVTTVKAEARRLMLDEIHTAPGKFATYSFTVNVRYPEINSGGQVRLKPRELNNLDWDHKLTLEFIGTRPSVDAIEITKVDDAVTVYLAGDSTVVDQDKEPWCAWGQMLPRFFKNGVAIANHAESGETLMAFMGEKRLDKIMSTIKAGDYLFIQFNHNDQKPGRNHVDAFTGYKQYLKLFMDEARNKGATPVLVTSMNRRNFDKDGKVVNTLGDYPEAMRQEAAQEHVALIDLNAMSKDFYEALGPENSKKAFVQYPAGTFPGQTAELKDNTHFNDYGAYELAKCIVKGIEENKLGLAKFLVSGLAPFNPSHPDPRGDWTLPIDPFVTIVKPLGN
ncbi:MAG: rhamnogalacturonan acetylesterase [Terriglobia bacterium]